MKIFEVTQNNYHALRYRLAGVVFHRIDEDGRYLISPLKSYENIVRIMAIKQLDETL